MAKAAFGSALNCASATLQKIKDLFENLKRFPGNVLIGRNKFAVYIKSREEVEDLLMGYEQSSWVVT
ncbi:MAG: hypothetical protein SGARI_007431 [Bacillariaceae sp.]